MHIIWKIIKVLNRIHWVRLVGLYAIIVGLAISGLVLNIKATATNEKSQKVLRQIQALVEENTLLESRVAEKSTLKTLDQKASQLRLHKPESMIYIGLAKPHENH